MYLMLNLVLVFLSLDRLVLFWYVALDLAVIKAMLLFLFCLIWLTDFQHIFQGCIVLTRRFSYKTQPNLNKSGYWKVRFSEFEPQRVHSQSFNIFYITQVVESLKYSWIHIVTLFYLIVYYLIYIQHINWILIFDLVVWIHIKREIRYNEFFATSRQYINGLWVTLVPNLFNIVSKERLLKVCYSIIILHFFYIWNMVLHKWGGNQM